MLMLSISANILRLVSGFGILQGVLLASVIYFHKKSDRSVNSYLALYILATSAIMTIPFIIQLVGWQNSYFIQPAPFLTGPLVYLYLRSFKERVTLRKALPHFIPFVLFFFIAYFNIKKFSALYPDAQTVPVEALRSPVTILILYLRPVFQVIYYILSRRVLKSYQRSIHHLFSETNRIELNWARLLINGYLVLVSSIMLIYPVILLFPQYFNELLLLNMAIATPYIYLVTFKGIMQPTIWQVQPDTNQDKVEEAMHEVEAIELQNGSDHRPRPKTGLSDDKISEIRTRILALMEQEKIYQEPELTLQELAKKLSVSPHHLSQAINDGMKKNFYDLVNGFRVEEAKKLLLDPKSNSYTILSIGFEAGFNSKTTFNTVFKKFTGMSPTAYRESQQMHAVTT